MNTLISRIIFCLTVVAAFCCGVVLPAESTTYYVRLDGGSATQCTGLVDAAYPGSGAKQPCAFSHPFWAHAPRGNNPTKMVGGDTLIIDGSKSAQYMMGYGAPNTGDTSKCHQNWSYECYMNPIPSGPDPAHPTRILGKGWDTGCSDPPQLWATERAEVLLNLQGSDNVELQCLDVTDHSDCQEHGPNPCNRTTPPFGKWGKIGLQAWDSESVLIKNVNIHGLAFKGVHAGRLKDWTLEDSRIVANSFVGWDGDVGAFNSSNSGTITFTRVVLQYSGCGETYPGEQPQNCYSQSQGGYGDGLGTHQTGANWVFNNVDFSHNASDGLDLLYHDGTGTVTIKRSRFEGNAGNQVKIAANAVIENSIIIGNCNYFNGRNFTYTKSPGFDNCRAGGNALVFAFHPGMKTEFYNSTILGSGDVLVLSTERSGCNGAERIISRNNIFLGSPQFGHPDITDLYYAAGTDGNGSGLCGNVQLDDDYSVVWATKNIKTACNGKKYSLCEDPKFNEPPVQWYYGNAYDVSLQSTSPAIRKGLVLTGKSSLDYYQNERGNVWDIGALEYDLGVSKPVCADGVQYCLTEPDCIGQAYYWYDAKCNVDPQRQSTCADGIQYCLTQVECVSKGYFWYTNACHAQPEPLPTCADGIQYCANQTDCVINAHYWYNNVCHANPKPQPGCADGIQYCANNIDCATNGHYWYNNTCNLQPKPLPTCVDGVQYCLTKTDCVNNAHYWYNNTCNLQAESLPTCADGIQYCLTKTDCVNNSHYWYNNTCNLKAQPTCADGIQYCLKQSDCVNNAHYWYNNTCNLQAEPLPTCADGIQYCLTKTDCVNNSHYWYNNTCNLKAQPTCADGIQYCLKQSDCVNNAHYWYNNTCNLQAEPLPTCVNGVQYCLTKTDCVHNGHHWYNNKCNIEPESKPTCADGIQYCLNRKDCDEEKHYWYDQSCHGTPKQSETTDNTTNTTTTTITPSAVEPEHIPSTETTNTTTTSNNGGGQSNASGGGGSGGFAGSGGSSSSSSGSFDRGAGLPSAAPVNKNSGRKVSAPRSQSAPSAKPVVSDTASPTPVFSNNESSTLVKDSATFASFAEKTTVPETQAVESQKALGAELDGGTYAELRKQLLKPEEESSMDPEVEGKIVEKKDGKTTSPDGVAEAKSSSAQKIPASVRPVKNSEEKAGVLESFQKGVQQMLQNFKAWFSGLKKT